MSDITKICLKCGVEKSLDDFHKAPHGLHGRKSECKACCKRYYCKRDEKIRLFESGLKKCGRCHEIKPLIAFGRHCGTIDGLRDMCRECSSVKSLKLIRYEEYRDSVYAAGLWKCRKCGQIKLLQNFGVDHSSIYGIVYTCKECKRVEDLCLYYKKSRQPKPIETRVLLNLRWRLKSVVRGIKYNHVTRGAMLDMVGCSLGSLKQHLESLFTEGMTWENYGLRGWHVDHIRPCSSYDPSIKEDMDACFHYSNLQPLWWYENLRKAGKLNWV